MIKRSQELAVHALGVSLCSMNKTIFIWHMIFSHLILFPSSDQQLSLWEAELMHLEYLNILASVVVLKP